MDLYRKLATANHCLESEDLTVVLPITPSIARARLKAFDPYVPCTEPIEDIHTWDAEASAEALLDLLEWLGYWVYREEDDLCDYDYDYFRDYDYDHRYDYDEWRDHHHCEEEWLDWRAIGDLKAWNEGYSALDPDWAADRQAELELCYRTHHALGWSYDYWEDDTDEEIEGWEDGWPELRLATPADQPSLNEHHNRKAA